VLPLPFRSLDEVAVHPSATTFAASAPATSKADIAPTLEGRIGALVAAAGIALAEALDEQRLGALSLRTKMRSGDLICELVRLRQFLIADFPDFDRVAREHGVAMLRLAGASPATADCSSMRCSISCTRLRGSRSINSNIS
jgi:hypothetical protein